jgi:hypothetical protein
MMHRQQPYRNLIDIIVHVVLKLACEHVEPICDVTYTPTSPDARY